MKELFVGCSAGFCFAVLSHFCYSFFLESGTVDAGCAKMYARTLNINDGTNNKTKDGSFLCKAYVCRTGLYVINRSA